MKFIILLILIIGLIYCDFTVITPPPTYETRWFNQTLDHFNFETQPRRYLQRYLWNDTFWTGTLKNGCKGPVFFYTGNEGDITSFWNNTGFVTQVLAPSFGGLLVFAEHRYYGESKPFGPGSLRKEYVGYLTSEQALADYADLINYLKATTPGMANCPIISVGGSYGGMLSAWFRLKYPNIVAGSLAASAPIALFYGTGVSQFAFAEIMTNDYTMSSPTCSSTILKALNYLVNNANNATALNQVQQQMGFCDQITPSNVYSVISWAEGAFVDMAMVDYPYAANFLMPLPAWPVSVACERIGNNSNAPLLTQLALAAGVYYNYTGEAGQCYKFFEPDDLGSQGWDYQSCTEMVMPISYNGVTDMFPKSLYNLTSTTETCLSVWDVIPRPKWITSYYGGFNITAGSNIIFSNGELDPWRSGGVQKSLSESLIAIYIENAAHHLDLRGPNPKDPNSVIVARQMEANYINQFIEEWVKTHP